MLISTVRSSEDDYNSIHIKHIVNGVCSPGFVVAMPLDNNLAHIGLFITAEEHRNKGIGKVVFHQALDALKGRNILIESVADRRGMYRNFGFTNSEQTIFSIKGIAQAIPGYKLPNDLEIRKVTEGNVGDVIAYDKSISTIDRSDHLTTWLLSSCSVTYAAFQDGCCVGFGSARECGPLYTIQPLYAESDEIAVAVIQALLTKEGISPGSKVVFYPVGQNKAQAVSLASKFGLTEVLPEFGFRMHTNEEVKFQWGKIFSITNKLNTII